MSIRLVGAATLCALAALALAQEAVTLKRIVKQGDTAKYRISASFTAQGKEYKFTAAAVDTVTNVEPSGEFTVETKASDGKLTVGEEVYPDATEVVTSTVCKPNGAISDATGKDEALPRLARIQGFQVPDKAIKAGDTWDAEIKADPKTKWPAMKLTYKVEAAEKLADFDTLRLKVIARELTGDAPMIMEGLIWIGVKDGSVVKSDTLIRNYPAGRGLVFDTKVLMVRSEIPQ